MRPSRRSALAALGLLTALALAGCGGAPQSGASDPPSSSAAAGPDSLKTLAAGKLTVATGQPAYSPWVEDDDPASGKGFESAVTYAVAKQLGYAKGEVVWVRSTFDSAVTPGAKPWDLNIQQFSVTADRKKAVDFSSPYYTTTQAVVAVKGSKGASATSVAALKGLRIGVAAGTTSLSTVSDRVGQQPRVFNNNDDVVQALKTKQLDAAVFDLPTAFYVRDAQLDDGVVVGQFAGTTGGDDFAYVLPKGSALTKPVSAALDALRDSGELKTLTDTWLSSEADAPVLQ